MVLRVPLTTIGYSFAAGFVEVLALGILYGLTLAPLTE
jgi:hypothetical protein